MDKRIFKVGDYITWPHNPELYWQVIYNCPIHDEIQVWKRVTLQPARIVSSFKCSKCKNHNCPVNTEEYVIVVSTEEYLYKHAIKVSKLKAIVAIAQYENK
mgnify:CR=1 FL=1